MKTLFITSLNFEFVNSVWCLFKLGDITEIKMQKGLRFFPDIYNTCRGKMFL